MKYNLGRTVVVALGGSIIYPDGIDIAFLKRFRAFLKPFLSRYKFIIVVGGGRLSRIFQDAAGRISQIKDEDKDWIGIHATRLNAHLLRTIFRDVADPVVIDARYRRRRLAYPLTIASGWRPGWSTDYVAVQLAADFGIGEVIIAGKPSHVYNKDHAEYKDARPIYTILWREYRKLIPSRWIPGLHTPVDPVAARTAEKAGINAIVIYGRDFKNFANLLRGKEFRGTIIGDIS